MLRKAQLIWEWKKSLFFISTSLWSNFSSPVPKYNTTLICTHTQCSLVVPILPSKSTSKLHSEPAWQSEVGLQPLQSMVNTINVPGKICTRQFGKAIPGRFSTNCLRRLAYIASCCSWKNSVLFASSRGQKTTQTDVKTIFLGTWKPPKGVQMTTAISW